VTEAPVTKLTVKQTAEALGCSVRTLRRRIAAGELSATKERRGQVDVTLLDAAEVARFAEAQGHTMKLPEGTEGTQEQPAAGTCDSEERGTDVATGAAAANEGQSEGTAGSEGQPAAVTGDSEGQRIGVPPVTSSGATGAQVRALQEQLRAVTEERDFLRRVLENVTRSLPEGAGSVQPNTQQERRAQDRPSWWARIFRGTKGETGNA